MLSELNPELFNIGEESCDGTHHSDAINTGYYSYRATHGATLEMVKGLLVTCRTVRGISLIVPRSSDEC